MDVGDNT